MRKFFRSTSNVAWLISLLYLGAGLFSPTLPEYVLTLVFASYFFTISMYELHLDHAKTMFRIAETHSKNLQNLITDAIQRRDSLRKSGSE